MGVVRLTEGKVDPDAMADKITRELELLEQQMASADVSVAPGLQLVGTAGTATTLAAISLGMEEYDYRKVNNHLLTFQEVRRIYELLLPLSPHERLAVAGLEKGREDLIIAGCLITLQTMQRFGCSSMR